MIKSEKIECINTPAYVFSKKALISSYQNLCKKMAGIEVYYSLKANAEPLIIECLSSVCTGFEVASDGEFDRVRNADIPASNIICGLPIKKISTIEHLYRDGCNYFIFDMLSELQKLNEYAPSSNKILRLNINDLLPNSLEFGMTIEEIAIGVRNGVFSSNNINGISFHISNNINLNDFNCVWNRAMYVIGLLQFHMKQSFILNIGGGYRHNAEDGFFSNLVYKTDNLRKQYPNIRIIAEPGNAIVNDAGSLFSRVIAVRHRKSFSDVYMDAGKPTGLKTDNKRLPSYIKVINKKPIKQLCTYRFVDLTCMHRPHFTFDLPYEIESGDILELGAMGAYTACLQSMFHVWPSPKIYIIE